FKLIPSLAPFALSVLPVLSSEQEVPYKDASRQKHRRVRLHRRKSGVANGSFREGRSMTRGTRSNTPQTGHETAVTKRRGSTPEASRPRTTSNSTSTAPDGVPNGRVVRSSGAPTELAVDPGQLKARMRVMEWKKRRAEELKHEEQSTMEQKQQEDVDTASARKLAAARAEEVQRRICVERENTVDTLRTQEMAERRAKNLRQKERRRAEIYAINAVMRAAFEKEFKTYSAEQEQRVKQSA
ncbi:unnamed protein product, partial [Hapterophycus canaliculatus]